MCVLRNTACLELGMYHTWDEEMCGLESQKRRDFLPRLDGDDCRWAGMTVYEPSFNYRLQIQAIPVFWKFFEQRIHVYRIGDYLTRGFGPFPPDSGQDNDWLSGHLVVNSGHHSVVLSQPGIQRIRSEERRVGKQCRCQWSP